MLGPVNGPSALSSRGCLNPKSCSAWAASCPATNAPKSSSGSCAAARAVSPATARHVSKTSVRVSDRDMRRSSNVIAANRTAGGDGDRPALPLHDGEIKSARISRTLRCLRKSIRTRRADEMRGRPFQVGLTLGVGNGRLGVLARSSRAGNLHLRLVPRPTVRPTVPVRRSERAGGGIGVRLARLHFVRLRQRGGRQRVGQRGDRVREVRRVEQVEDLRAELEIASAATGKCFAITRSICLNPGP